jgi:hypothetical protein
VATTTATSEPGHLGRQRARPSASTATPAAITTGAQTGAAIQARTASAASTTTLVAWTSTPSAARTCWRAMITPMPTVKPSTTGTGT